MPTTTKVLTPRVAGGTRKPNPSSATLETIEQDCRNDFALACARVMKIKPKDRPLAPFNLNWPQRYIVERDLQPALERGEPLVLVVGKGRQDGLSTVAVGWTFWRVRWYQGTTAIIAAHQDDTVSNMRDMIQRFHDNLPPEMQPARDRNNRKELHYLAPLDSSIRVRAAKYLDISRGKTPQIVVLSEVGYYVDPETVMAGVTESVPDYGPTLILMESTAAGMDSWFYDLWQDLGRSSGKPQYGRRKWIRRFIPWYWSPDKQAAMPPGRWEQLRAILPNDLVAYAEEFEDIQERYNLEDAQIMWYLMKLGEFLRTHGHLGRRLLAQEQPCTAKEMFITGGECIFAEAGLKNLQRQIAEPQCGFELARVGTWDFTMVPRPLRTEPALLVWERPQHGYRYALGIDVSRGVGQDASAVVVVRMPGYVQVAHWHDTHTSTKDLAFIVAAIGTYYAQGGDRPICTVELNDAGIHTNVELTELAQTKPIQLYIWEYLDRLGSSPVTHLSKTGWVTSVSTKPIMIGVANSLLMAGQCVVPSEELQVDMGHTQEIIRDGRSYASTGGCDLTIAWLLAVITAWRKIQRLSFPGFEHINPGAPTLQPGEMQHEVPEVFRDTTWHPAPVATGASFRPGDSTIDWRIQ